MGRTKKSRGTDELIKERICIGRMCTRQCNHSDIKHDENQFKVYGRSNNNVKRKRQKLQVKKLFEKGFAVVSDDLSTSMNNLNISALDDVDKEKPNGEDMLTSDIVIDDAFNSTKQPMKENVKPEMRKSSNSHIVLDNKETTEEEYTKHVKAADELNSFRQSIKEEIKPEMGKPLSNNCIVIDDSDEEEMSEEGKTKIVNIVGELNSCRQPLKEEINPEMNSSLNNYVVLDETYEEGHSTNAEASDKITPNRKHTNENEPKMIDRSYNYIVLADTYEDETSKEVHSSVKAADGLNSTRQHIKENVKEEISNFSNECIVLDDTYEEETNKEATIRKVEVSSELVAPPKIQEVFNKENLKVPHAIPARRRKKKKGKSNKSNNKLKHWGKPLPLADTTNNQREKEGPSMLSYQPEPDMDESMERYGKNYYAPKKEMKAKLRPVYIDGSNVAFGYTNGKYFSVTALKICIDYFLKRGHEVHAFVPHFRKNKCSNPVLFQQLIDNGLIITTPSRYVNGRNLTPYDDRYIVKCAAVNKGIIVSCDNYRDLIKENPSLQSVIEKRLLMPLWVKDMLIFPDDPLGRNGPSLEEFLRF